MNNTGLLVGADLDGVFGAKEDACYSVVAATELGKMLGDEVGVVEAAGADVLTGGGEGNDDDIAFELGQGGIHDFGERLVDGADGMVLEIMNEDAEEVGAFADNVSSGLILAIFAFACGVGRFANGTNILMGLNNVIFTTIAKNAP